MSAIKRIEIIEFSYPIRNLALDENGFDYVYSPGVDAQRTSLVTRIET